MAFLSGTADHPARRASPRLDWNSTGVWLLPLGPAIAVAGVTTGDAPTVAIGVAVAIVIGACAGWAIDAVRGVRVTRRYRTRVPDHDAVAVRWRIETTSRWPLMFVDIAERCLLQKGPDIAGAIAGPLARRAPAEVGFTVACERGRGAWQLGPGLVRGRDPLGLFRVSVELAPADEPIRVYPRPIDISRLPLAGDLPWRRAGRRALHLPGVGEDFSGVREYRPGDPLRHIHWRATARLGQLVVKEFDQLVRPDICVVLDLSRASRLGTGEHSSTDYGIRLAASLAAWAVERGHRAQVIAAHGTALATTGLGAGREHLLRIIDELAVWRGSGEMSLADVVDAAGSARMLPPGSVVVLIAPTRALFLADMPRLFARFETSQLLDVAAVALSEAGFHALHAGQQLAPGEADSARHAAAGLVLRGIDVSILDVSDLAPRRRVRTSEAV